MAVQTNVYGRTRDGQVSQTYYGQSTQEKPVSWFHSHKVQSPGKTPLCSEKSGSWHAWRSEWGSMKAPLGANHTVSDLSCQVAWVGCLWILYASGKFQCTHTCNCMTWASPLPSTALPTPKTQDLVGDGLQPSLPGKTAQCRAWWGSPKPLAPWATGPTPCQDAAPTLPGNE